MTDDWNVAGRILIMVAVIVLGLVIWLSLVFWASRTRSSSGRGRTRAPATSGAARSSVRDVA